MIVLDQGFEFIIVTIIIIMSMIFFFVIIMILQYSCMAFSYEHHSLMVTIFLSSKNNPLFFAKKIVKTDNIQELDYGPIRFIVPYGPFSSSRLFSDYNDQSHLQTLIFLSFHYSCSNFMQRSTSLVNLYKWEEY